MVRYLDLLVTVHVPVTGSEIFVTLWSGYFDPLSGNLAVRTQALPGYWYRVVSQQTATAVGNIEPSMAAAWRLGQGSNL